jgi:hypothetical protein
MVVKRLINIYRIKTFSGDVYLVRCEFLGELLDMEQLHVKSCVKCQCQIMNMQCKVRFWRWRRIMCHTLVTDYYGQENYF